MAIFLISILLGCGKSQDDGKEIKQVPAKVETLVLYEHKVGMWQDWYTTGVFKVTAKFASAKELNEQEISELRTGLSHIQKILSPAGPGSIVKSQSQR